MQCGSQADQYVYSYDENTYMREWVDTILEVGSVNGYWENPEIVQDEERFRPGSDVEELLVGYEKFIKRLAGSPK